MPTILLVEDELNQRLLYQMELEDEGYRVVLASDGWEALQQSKEEHPDLVVLDLGMPGMDGIEALGRMMDQNAKLPVIIYTGDENFKDNFMTWVADAYLVKRSNLDALKEEIERVLLERKGERYRIWPVRESHSWPPKGEEYGFPPLVAWGKRLGNQVAMFDMDALSKTLVEFPEIIEGPKSLAHV